MKMVSSEPLAPLPVKFVDYISTLYSPNSTAENNSITYNLDTTNYLMNDRLGGAETLESGTGNIRYYGANPNNYVDIGDVYTETITVNGIEHNAGDPVLYRIIGLFKDIKLSDGTTHDLIKIIREEPLSSAIEWSSNTNDWHNANIQLYLKNTFYQNLSSSVKGITVEVYWNLGAHNTSNGLYSNDIYDYERGNSKCSTCTYDTVWSGRVALMYASDYGYASNLGMCTQYLSNYHTDNENCVRTNWLYDGNTQWLLTQNDEQFYLTWLLDSQGSASTEHSTKYDITYSYKARPVLFLNSEQIMESGHAGTEGDPYKIIAS